MRGRIPEHQPESARAVMPRHELGLDDTVGILGQPGVQPDRTSAGLGWREAYLSAQTEHPYEATFGQARTHLLILHLGGPAVVRRGEGRSAEERIVPAGGFFLHPAGRELAVALRTELPTIHAAIDDEVVAHAAGDRDVDLAEYLGPNDPMVEQLVLALDSTVRNWDPSARTYVDHLTHALAAHLVHRYSVAGTGPARNPEPDWARSRIDDVIEVMRARLAEPLALPDLAATAALSTSQLTRQFKNSTGLTPHRYLLRLRIEHAARLLRTTEEPIANIALDCGFSHQEHMTRTMKAQLGTTPAAVRRDR